MLHIRISKVAGELECENLGRTGFPNIFVSLLQRHWRNSKYIQIVPVPLRSHLLP